MLAGVCRVPLTAVLLLFELTHDFRILLPLMAGVGLSSWVASTSGGPASLFIAPPPLSSKKLNETESIKRPASTNDTAVLSNPSPECADVPYSLEDSLCTISEFAMGDNVPRDLPALRQDVQLKTVVCIRNL